MTDTKIALAEMCERFGIIYTGAVTDVMDQMKLYHQTLPSYLKPIKFGSRTVGAAYPCTGNPGRAVDYDEAIRPLLQMLGEAPTDSVVVYDTNDSSSAHLGELSVISIKTRGCRGAIIDGGIRDIEYILEEDFPVWARYATPADSVPRWQLVDWNCVVTVGEVRIEPGDMIIGDYDGVVAVPGKIAAEVLLQCEELVKTESKVRNAMREGISPLEAYDKFGEF